MMSAEELNLYSDGITGSHFMVGGIDRMMIPLQVSSVIGVVVRLSTAAFRILRVLICSWISLPSTYMVRFSASWA